MIDLRKSEIRSTQLQEYPGMIISMIIVYEHICACEYVVIILPSIVEITMVVIVYEYACFASYDSYGCECDCVCP